MKRIRYILLAMVFITGSCSTPSQVETEPSFSATSDIISNLIFPTPSALPPTSIPTPTVEIVQQQEPTLVTKYVFPYDYLTINDVYFIDENNGWAIGNLEWYEQTVSSIACCQPKLFNTTDGGGNWIEVETGIASGLLNSIVWTDAKTGYIVGQESFFENSKALILRTIDGGKHWKRVGGNQQKGRLNFVVATQNNGLWGVGEDYSNSLDSRQSLILRSMDGLNWKTQIHPSQIGAELTAIAFPSEKVGYAIGFIGHDSPDPYIIKTLDGGDNWVELPTPFTTGRLLDMVFLNDVTGYIVGHHGDTSLIAITNDGAENWTIDMLQSGVWLHWFTESKNRFVILGNCADTDYCNNLIGLFNGKELFPFETVTFPDGNFTAVGNSMSDGNITFVVNTKPETWDAKYQTTFFRYNVP